MLDIIENSILDKLRENFPEFETGSFPAAFEDYTYTSPAGCILVRFESSDMSNQNTVCAVMPDAVYNLTVFASVRYAGKHSDCYSFLTRLKSVLNGLTILNKRLVLKNQVFETEIAGDLWYSNEVSITLPLTDMYKDLSGAGKELAVLNQEK